MAGRQGPGRAEAVARRKALRLHGSIARDLGVQIVSGRYQPGHIFNGEIDASDRLQGLAHRVSRGGAHSRCQRTGRVAAQGRHAGERAGALAPARPGCAVVDFRARAGRQAVEWLVRAAADRRAAGRGAGGLRRSDAELARWRGRSKAWSEHSLAVEAGRARRPELPLGVAARQRQCIRRLVDQRHRAPP